eukprot:CAMPEP_0176117792 /NCGR_PEP_ID=MMETSP0120_2-20121206/59181_1 /TAXON_ID=160619 /ORGANISM="Kryptoperidinium foliaceum, Strain CCMP 1326" /LENGTH=112 /DNA_ID=CAMNT_0017452095 /DNA_START=212 /DNA_END=550 /DNA_ORIENTATION=-
MRCLDRTMRAPTKPKRQKRSGFPSTQVLEEVLRRIRLVVPSLQDVVRRLVERRVQRKALRGIDSELVQKRRPLRQASATERLGDRHAATAEPGLEVSGGRQALSSNFAGPFS